MTNNRMSATLGLKVGVSILALTIPQIASAQDASTQDSATTDETAQEAAADASPTAPPPADKNDIIITGIRGSLQKSMNIKKNAVGVVDAISAEDIGKFPDTNLAESLQRITGVSIDRTNGEGTNVTVRGFGPEFNLVLLNGRQMPTSTLGDGASPPSSRSFDFGNLASEGIASVEVYKSGRATLPTGGIGSVINIRTPRPLDRPGFRASLSAKAVVDHGFDKRKVTPEFSGIISDTFADNRIGILVTGSYQRRKSDLAQFSAGWREGFLGTDSCDTGNWGALPQAQGSWCGNPANITNRPEGNDIYQLPQNAAYDFINIDRRRINGQAVLQVKPTDTLDATLDYTFSQNTVDARTNSIGIWFTHTNGTSVWTDGPVAGAEFVSEAYSLDQAKDLAITGAVAKNRSINHSLGGNLRWDGPGGLRAELDAHHSTAESKPTSPYGSSIAVGSAIFGIKNHSVDFTSDMPVISVDMYPGFEIAPQNIRPSGNAFRTAYMKDRINEVSLRGGYDFNTSFLDAIDFGVTLTDNKVRSAYGFLQNETWGGTLSAADTPDGLYDMVNLPHDLRGMGGTGDPSIIPNYFRVDTEGLIALLESQLGICSDPQVGTPTGEGCLAEYSVDRRIREKSLAPYIQSTSTFDLLGNPAHLRMGLRYERTKINSSALTPVPTGVIQFSENEMGLVFDGSSDFITRKGEYKNWLPAVDFDMSPMRNFKLRASYSHTITRPDYGSLQGGLTLNPPLRPNGGSTANGGNPDLLPYKSKNIDLSAEWYYAPSSYISAGFFHKKVTNFIGQFTTIEPLFNLTNPSKGAAEDAARAALGGNPSFAQILAYLDSIDSPVVFYDNGVATGIIGQPGDPLVDFIVSQPGNSDQVAKLHGFEFALQHNFWDTGFGVILNYTIVKSNSNYDNTLRFSVPQFAVPGVSDSANAVVYYDKNGLQARVAYNWRDKFLSGYGLDPFYVEPYGQFDVSASYEFKRGFTVFLEGINVTNADRRGHRRSDLAAFFAQPGYARYAAGVRVSFGGDAPLPPPPPVVAPPPPPPPPPPPATQTCPDGSVILATDTCPAPPPPPPPPPPAPERGN